MVEKNCEEWDAFGKCVKWQKRKSDGAVILELEQSKDCPVDVYRKAKSALLNDSLVVRVKADDEREK